MSMGQMEWATLEITGRFFGGAAEMRRRGCVGQESGRILIVFRVERW
jgi:hypothetical protein